MPRRPDAELVKMTKFAELMFNFMPGRNESVVYFNMLVDLTRTLEFLDEYNKDKNEKDKLTLFELMLTAGVRTIVQKPKMNRFVSGRRLWQRNQIIIAFTIKKQKTDEGEEVNAMIEFDPFDTLQTVQKRVSDAIHEARYGKNKNEKDIQFFGALPRWFIRFLVWLIRWTDEHNHPLHFLTKDIPLWSTAFVAQLGSIGIDAVYHHPFEIGNASIFITIGKIHKAALVNQETDQMEIKKVVELRVSLDERIGDGFNAGPAIYLLKDLIEKPESLLQPPELTDKQVDGLKLKKYKKERLEREKGKRQ